MARAKGKDLHAKTKKNGRMTSPIGGTFYQTPCRAVLVYMGSIPRASCTRCSYWHNVRPSIENKQTPSTQQTARNFSRRYRHKYVETHRPEAATVSTGHHMSLRVGLPPVEPLSRPGQAPTDALRASCLTRRVHRMQRQPPSHDTAIQVAMTETRHSLSAQ